MKQIKITNKNIGQNVIDGQYEQIGIRMPEGTKFSINGGSSITIGSTGIYEINLVNTNSVISKLEFTEFPKNPIEGYVDLVKKGYEGSLYGNVINPPKSIQKINEIDAQNYSAIKLISGNGINIETNSDEIKIINNYPVGKTSSVGSYGEVFNNYNMNKAIGIYSHAEGHTTEANGSHSHAEGRNTKADGYASHAEGHLTEANGDYSHAENYGTVADGKFSHAEGHSTKANGDFSHAEGHLAEAVGNYSHSEGQKTKANGEFSHAEGGSTEAAGSHSHAEGHMTKANGECSHAEGLSTIAVGIRSHAEGYSSEANGNYSHAENYNTNANGNYSHAEGYGTKASGECSHTEGHLTEATGTYSHAEGHNTIANGMSSHTEGYGTNALNDYSHTEGYKTIASANAAHAEGNSNTASATAAHAEGSNNIASGPYAHVEGYSNTASASSTHVEGCYNQATENAGYSHVEGAYNIAKAQNTHVEGRETIASSNYQHVSGKANIEDGKGKYACIVGNGTIATRDDKGNIIEEAKRSNAHTLDWNGNAWYQGLVQAAGFVDADGKPVGGITEITEDTFMADLEPGIYKISVADDSYGLWLDDAYWWCLYEGLINIAYSEYDNIYIWTFVGRDNMVGSTVTTGKTSWEEDGYWYCNEFLDLYNTVESNYNKVNNLDSPDYITYPSTKAVVDYVDTKTAPKVFEKIATYTVTPDADGNLPSMIIINKDESGNDFELTDMYVEMKIAFNNSDAKFYMTAAGMGAILGNGSWGFTSDALRKWCFRVDSYGEGNGGLITAPSNSTIITGNYPNPNISTMSGQPIPPGKTVVMRDFQIVISKEGRVFKEGSTITLWGVRK